MGERLACIDPGTPGGYLFTVGELGPSGEMEFVSCSGVPTEMAEIVRRTRPSLGVIEQVHCGLMSKVANFKLGMNYGIWLGIFAGMEIPVVLVTPQEWQRKFRKIGEDRGLIQRRGKNVPKVENPVNVKEVVWTVLKEINPELFTDPRFIAHRSHRSDAFGIRSWYRDTHGA